MPRPCRTRGSPRLLGSACYDAGMSEVPFFIRRPYLLTRDLLVDRDEPDLESLAAIEEPWRFVWAILPHAARTFSACIALLPKRSAEAAAVGYLYCRMLDTYEDLVVDPNERDDALRSFADRFEPPVGSAPSIGGNHASDQRDAGHLLLVRRSDLVDRAYAELDPQVQQLIRVLVRDMSEGMRWSSGAFVQQGGVLLDEAQLARYCRGVLGHPVLFSSRLLRWYQTGDPVLPVEIEEQAMVVGEMIQLANVTRDIEKDLRRGIAYHPALRDDLGVQDVAADPELTERVRAVREELLLMALRRAPAYRPLIEYLSPSRISLARASGVLMLSFTDQYFRSCARRAGREPWGPRQSSTRVILSALPAVWSRRSARRSLSTIEQDFLRASA